MNTSVYRLIFSNEPRYWLLRHGLFWSVWFIFSLLIYLPVNMRAVDVSTGRVLLLTMSESVLFIIFSHAIFAYLLAYWLLPQFFDKKHWGFLILGFLAVIFIQAMGSYLAGELLARPLRTSLSFPYRTSSYAYGMLAGVRGGMTVGGFVVAIKLAKRFFLQQQQLLQIQKEKLTAELQVLKAQVHPHFLFNTLNNLYALTLRKSDRSPEVVLKLSNLLSYMLYECNAVEVPLEREIAFLKNYISLEQLRYGDRLDVSVNFTGDIPGKRIAPLLLVPLLENAFKHGTSEQLDQAWISVGINVQDNVMHVRLVNSRDVESVPFTQAGGIGLQNVRKRLELLYPNRHELRLLAEEEMFLVSLTLTLDAALPDTQPDASQVQTNADSAYTPLETNPAP